MFYQIYQFIKNINYLMVTISQYTDRSISNDTGPIR